MGFTKWRHSPDGFAISTLALFYTSLQLDVIDLADARSDHRVYITTAPCISAAGADIRKLYTGPEGHNFKPCNKSWKEREIAAKDYRCLTWDSKRINFRCVRLQPSRLTLCISTFTGHQQQLHQGRLKQKHKYICITCPQHKTNEDMIQNVASYF